MIQINRSAQIYLINLKAQIKRSPFCGVIALRAWWILKRLRYLLKNSMGQYPITKGNQDGYEQLSTSDLANSIALTLSKPHQIGVSCIASELDFYIPEFKQVFMDMIEPVGKMERKSWEFVMTTLGLKKLGAFDGEKTGIGIGSGCEKPLYYYSRFSKLVTGTDLYLNNDTLWQHTAHSDILLNPSKYAPFTYPKSKLRLMHMNALELQFSNNTFDYAFSFSAIEHFGSRKNIEKTMAEIERVLKPGGIAAITTEFIISKNATHPEYFTFEELTNHMLSSHNMELVGPIDMRLAEQDITHILDLKSDMRKNIAIIFKNADVVFTPLLLFFRKRT